jgi:nanoRNase/pAp phosphatase (c-di-AMP/oligoRNAs hydrolase)
MPNNHFKNIPLTSEMNKLNSLMKDAKHLLIVVHTNPDPDAIASAAALQFLIKQNFYLEGSIAFSGTIGRAENQMMLKELKIHMKQISKINWSKYDRIALVDTQPGSGNNVLPDNVRCHLVLDHHPARKYVKTDLSIIHPELGVLATMLIEWLIFLEFEIPADLATALVYAISSESQNLKREIHQRDLNAYLYVYVRANLKKLAQIMQPPLPRQYYAYVARTLQTARTYRNLIIAHLGEAYSAEIVSEMADFLVRHERISWSFCTGRFKDKLIISIRSRNPKAKAGKLVQMLVKNSKTAGGHGMYAGGFLDISETKKTNIQILENKLSKKFAELHNYDNPDWKSLYE